MSRESEFWANGPRGNTTETSLSRYLRSIQEGDKYYIKRTANKKGNTKRTNLKAYIATPPSTPHQMPPRPKPSGPSAHSSHDWSPPTNDGQCSNSQFTTPPSTQFNELKELIHEVSKDLRLGIQQLTDKLDHLNDNVNELTQCTHEIMLELKIDPVPRRSSTDYALDSPNFQRPLYAQDSYGVHEEYGGYDGYKEPNEECSRAPARTPPNTPTRVSTEIPTKIPKTLRTPPKTATHNAVDNSPIVKKNQFLKSLVATTCFLTPIMVFLVDYHGSIGSV